MELMDKAAKKFVNDDLDKFDYKRIKESIAKECAELRNKIAELKSTETGFQEYYRYGFSLLSNLDKYYSTANLENRQKMLGLIFPEKLVFSNNTFQTMHQNKVLTLLCNIGKGFSGSGNEKSGNNAAQSCVVTALGFKPKTFSSVVRCSIQLSYAAIFLLEGKYTALYNSAQLQSR